MTEYTNKKAKELNLKATTTPEMLEEDFRGMDGKAIRFGDYIIIAGYRFMWGNGGKGNSYYWAAYLFADKSKTTIEDEVKLEAVGNDFEPDEGHAIAKAFEWVSQWG